MNDKMYFWIKCDRDIQPNKYLFASLVEMLNLLNRLMQERGPIEIMWRDN